MQVFWYLLLLVVGLVLGSFLNVVIYRLPRHQSLARPGSRCPSCGTAIRWYDNIPLVSWLLLKGKCRACRAAISSRYPFVEILCAALFVLAMWRFGVSWRLLIACAFVASMIAVAFIDLDHMIIPNKIVLPGALLGLAASVALDPARWWIYLSAGIGAAAFMFILVMLWPGGMGPGDVKMALFMGVVLGASVIVGLFGAFLLGSVIGLYMVWVQKRSRKTRIPFGPYLALGSVVALFFGDTIIHAYTGLL